MNNWPHLDKPGVPLNPEKDGWHFVERQKEITAIEWISGEWWTGGLGTYGGGYYNSEYIGLNYTYLGPCLPPSEVASQIEQARREGVKVIVEAAESILFCMWPDGIAGCEDACDAIRSLALPGGKDD